MEEFCANYAEGQPSPSPVRARVEEEITREDRARRGRTEKEPIRSEVVFAKGNLVMHDLMGEAVVRAPMREDGTVSIEWKRTKGRGQNKRTEFLNRWVLPSSLTKFGDEPPSPVGPQQEGLFGEVFSLLEALFGDQQSRALSDYMETALMLAYHGRNNNK